MRAAIRGLADVHDAQEDRSNEYGTFYRVEGPIVGPSATLQVICIWMKRAADEKYFFVTLKPSRKGER